MNKTNYLRQPRKKIMLACMLAVGLIIIQCRFMGTTDPTTSQPPASTNDEVTRSPEISTWILSIGGAGRDYAPSFTQTNDGFVVVGMSSSYGLGDGGGNQGGSHDLLALKVNRFGKIVWSRTIGGPADERGSFSVTHTQDGGFLLTGTSASFGVGRTDIFIVKLNAQGDLEWSVAIGGAGSESGMTTLETNDGYMVLGSTDSFGAGKKDLLAVKLTSTREISWAKTYGGVEDDIGSGAAFVNGGYLIGGTMWSYGAGEADAGLILIDGAGNFKKGWTIGGALGEGINWDGVRVTSDGGFIFGDKTASFGAKGDGAFFGVKLRPNGAMEWSTMIDGPGEDVGWTMNETEDGFIAGGKINLPPNGGNVMFAKFDQQGNHLWARSFGSEGLDEIEEIKQVVDGYMMVGVTRIIDPAGDFLIAKVNSDGFMGGDSDPIVSLDPHSVISITPEVSPFSPNVSDVSTDISVMDASPTVTTPDLQVHTISGIQ